MGFWDNLEKVAMGVGEALVKAGARAQERQYQQNREQKIGGKSITEWDREWRTIGILSDADFSTYNKSVGLYRARLDGRVVYIGRAIEHLNGGFRKRLNDYTRQSDSARKHGSGKMMNAHNLELQIDLLEVGGDAAAANITRQLEKIFIGKYSPDWNKQLK